MNRNIFALLISLCKKRIVWVYKHFKRRIKKTNSIISNYENYEKERLDLETKRHVYKLRIVESYKKLYAWVLWEYMVINKLSQSNFEWILINDFAIRFNSPIFTKWWKDKIMSFQIDHILINKSWIFLFETKNRSSEYSNSSNFSPFRQIERSWHAFYISLKNQLKYKKVPPIYKVVISTNKNSYNEDNY